MDVSKDCCSTSTGFLIGFVSPNKRVCEFVGFGVESAETEQNTNRTFWTVRTKKSSAIRFFNVFCFSEGIPSNWDALKSFGSVHKDYVSKDFARNL